MKEHSPPSFASAGSGPALFSLSGLHGDGAPAGNRYKDHIVVRLISAMAECEAAVLEKSSALLDKKRALADRDSALLQREMAIADRDSALAEADRAMHALDLMRSEQEMCAHCRWNRQYGGGGGGAGGRGGQKYALKTRVFENIQPLAAIGETEGLLCGGDDCDPPLKKKRRRSKKPKDGGANCGESVWKNGGNGSILEPVPEAHRTLLLTSAPAEGKPQKVRNTKVTDADALAAPLFDRSKIPSPYCSCTGTNEQCYRWGNGGWQSACCTNTISMHPLPMNPKKKGCRVAGRKMSAGAFTRLIWRLVSEGWNADTPLDLKDFWAKHGTNMYVTIK